MKLILCLAAALMIFASCSSDRRSHKYTFKREKGLYVEVYASGILRNLTSEYLTDSLTFRTYLGTFDDEVGFISCKIIDDRVIVEKHEKKEGAPPTDQAIVVERKVLSIKKLKEANDYQGARVLK